MSASIKKYQLILFFSLTLILTWAIWLPAAITKQNGLLPAMAPDTPLGSLGRWMPGVVAILLALLTSGQSCLGQLFRPLRIWRVNIFWYIFALAFPIILFYVGKTIDAWLGNAYVVTSPLADAPPVMLPFVIVFALPGVLFEELGWRGFALPRLQKKYSALLASIVIGFVWGIWHIPSLIYFGELQASPVIAGALAVLDTILVTVLYTWLFNNTRGSLLLVFLFHLAQQLTNNFLGVLPTYTDTILLLVTAILIILLTGANNFSRSSQYQIAA